MGFSMKVSNEAIEGKDVVPPGEYELKLVSFAPKVSKKGDSFNYNPKMEIVGNPEYVNRFVFDSLNTPGGAFTQPDFVHAFGLPMETDGKDSWMPGAWNGDASKYDPNDPNTWVYVGPLVGRTAKVEIIVDNYNGKDNNKINRYFCAVPDCATKFPKIRHIANLVKK